MNKLESHLWMGQSGMEYEYWVCPLNAGFADHPGNYIYAARTEDDRWKALYIAETDSLKHRAKGHEGERCALAKGATHLHVRLNTEPEEVRERERDDLITFLRPACNVESQPEEPQAVVMEVDTMLTVSPHKSAAESAAGSVKPAPAAARTPTTGERSPIVTEVEAPAPPAPASRQPAAAVVQAPSDSAPASHEWQGESGSKYKYWMFPLDTRFDAEPGNFIYAAIDAHGRWQALYIGQSDNLEANLVAGNPRTSNALSQGATHIHVHKSSEYGLTRKVEQEDLVKKHKPICNG